MDSLLNWQTKMAQPQIKVLQANRHLSWVDQLKGVGILAVVAGHIYSGTVSDLLFLWHMPLFFMLSGFLYRPSPDFRGYFWSKVVHLLVPYASFLAILSIPDLVQIARGGDIAAVAKFVAVQLRGGRYLVGWFGVFWFITCLFLTQQVANYLFQRLSLKALWSLMAVLLIAAYASSAKLSPVRMPWNADVVMVALPMFFLGWRCKVLGLVGRHGVLIALVAVGGLILEYFRVIEPFNMKFAHYGTPVASLVFAVAICMTLTRALSLGIAGRQFGGVLSSLGGASMVIMFVHQTVSISLTDAGYPDRNVRMVAAVAIPWMLYFVLTKTAVTRAFFLGSKADLDSLRSAKAAPA